MSTRRGANALIVKLGAARPLARYAIWARYGANWRFAVAPGGASEWSLPDEAGGPASAVVVSAVDRLGNESERVSALPN